jgi:hypothetical protein
MDAPLVLGQSNDPTVPYWDADRPFGPMQGEGAGDVPGAAVRGAREQRTDVRVIASIQLKNATNRLKFYRSVVLMVHNIGIELTGRWGA